MGRWLRYLSLCVLVSSSYAASAPSARADVVAAYELTDPAVVPGGGVAAITQGAPGQPLVITLDDTPGERTLKIVFVADVDEETALWGYAVELLTTAETVTASALEYFDVFEFELVVPPDLVLTTGPGAILDEAAEGTFSPASGMLEFFEVTLVVTVPTAEVEIFTKLGEFTWASTNDPFLITIADSDPLSSDTFDTTSTPSIIIRVMEEPIVDCNTNGIPDSDEIAGLPAIDCDTNGVIDSCDLAAGATDCDSNGILDTCEVANTSIDCNQNGVPDRCEVASEAAPDCNSNGIPDRCDIAGGTSPDTNANGVPEECEAPNPDSETPETPTQPPSDTPARAVNRTSLRNFLAVLFGIPSVEGPSLARVPLFLGPLGIPFAAVLGVLEWINLPIRVAAFELTYAILDAFLP
ncbi:MAG TPA: hypothetical protein VJZ71_17370 [Phycisphaerae bacterium]|nr:hypothetical protein [Phycisphaerae bacterium]